MAKAPEANHESDGVFDPSSDKELWPVIEITAEDKSKGFKVRWEGNDPATGRPWTQSWVQRHEVTADLVHAWQERKAKKRRKPAAKAKTNRSFSRGGSKSVSMTPRKDNIKPNEETDYEQPPIASTSRTPTVSDTGPEEPTQRLLSPRKRKRVSTPLVLSDGSLPDLADPNIWAPAVVTKKRKVAYTPSDEGSNTSFKRDQKGKASPLFIRATSKSVTPPLQEAFAEAYARSPSPLPPPPRESQFVEDSLEHEIISSQHMPPKNAAQKAGVTHAPASTSRTRSSRVPSPSSSDAPNKKRLRKADRQRLKQWERDLAELEEEAEMHRTASANVALEMIVARHSSPEARPLDDDGIVPETQSSIGQSQDAVPAPVQRGSVVRSMNGRSPSKGSLGGHSPAKSPITGRSPSKSSVIGSSGKKLAPIPQLTQSAFTPYLQQEETIEEFSSPIKPPKGKGRQHVDEVESVSAATRDSQNGVEDWYKQRGQLLADEAKRKERGEAPSKKKLEVLLSRDKSKVFNRETVSGSATNRRLREAAEQRAAKSSPPPRQLSAMPQDDPVPMHELPPLSSDEETYLMHYDGISQTHEEYARKPSPQPEDGAASNEDTVDNDHSLDQVDTEARRLAMRLEEEESTQDIVKENRKREELEMQQREDDESQRRREEKQEEGRREEVVQLEEERARSQREEDLERVENTRLEAEEWIRAQQQEQRDREDAERRERERESEERERDARKREQEEREREEERGKQERLEREDEDRQCLEREREIREQEEQEDREREEQWEHRRQERQEREKREHERAEQDIMDIDDLDLNDKSLELAYPQDEAPVPLPASADHVSLQQVPSQSEEVEEKLKATGSTKLLQIAHEDALRKLAEVTKDKEFLDEHYKKQSEFVTSIRQENSALQAKVAIAEKQASEGVALIRAMFEKRIDFLEKDAKSWQTMAMFLQEKDARTNDEVRRRAAEHSGLEADNQELRAQLAIANMRAKQLQKDLDVLEDQVALMKQEAERRDAVDVAMHVEDEMDRSAVPRTKVARKGKPRDSQHGRSQEVYFCRWRVGDEAREMCGVACVSIEALREHMFEAEHLDRHYDDDEGIDGL